MKYLRKHWLWMIINIVALLPLIGLMTMIDVTITDNGIPVISLSEAVMLDEPSHDLEGNEAEVGNQTTLGLMTHITGEWAIRFLVISLSCTPLAILFGWRQILTIKKSTGLWAFGYATLHLGVFIAEEGWLATFTEFNFVMGLISLLIMVPLAITSNEWSMRWLRKNWKNLHRVAYSAGIFALLHVAFLGEGLAIVYTILIGLGFVLRVPQVRRLLANRHQAGKRSPIPA